MQESFAKRDCKVHAVVSLQLFFSMGGQYIYIKKRAFDILSVAKMLAS